MKEYRGVGILYEDNHVLVCLKPCNMPSQADSSGDADIQSLMKEYLARAYGKQGNVYLGLVHRLDRPVSGLMVFARTSKAAARLSAQVREQTLKREYLAVVRGEMEQDGRLVDWLLKDGRTNRVSVCPKDTPGAREARLNYRVMGRRNGLTLVQVRLETGRSHQIRVQFAHSGHPLWGDARYGNGAPGEQIALFGAGLTLVHPVRKEPMFFRAFPKNAEPWSAFQEEIRETSDEQTENPRG